MGIFPAEGVDVQLYTFSAILNVCYQTAFFIEFESEPSELDFARLTAAPVEVVGEGRDVLPPSEAEKWGVLKGEQVVYHRLALCCAEEGMDDF